MAEANQKKDGEKKKEKTPTAQKRERQNEKRQLRNRQMKSRISTALKAVKSGIDKKEDKTSVSEKLNLVAALLDKGTKKGLVHKNKAARLKSKLAKRASAV